MAEDKDREIAEDEAEVIAAKAERKRRALKRHVESPLYGIGMFGLVGWAVALPTVLGIALGIWIDRRWPSETSWTLVLLVSGAMLGAFNAWYWIARESRDE